MFKEAVLEAPREQYAIKPNSKLYVIPREIQPMFHYLTDSMQRYNMPIKLEYYYTDDEENPVTIRATSFHLPFLEYMGNIAYEEIKLQQKLPENERDNLFDIFDQTVKQNLFLHIETGFPGESPEVI